MTKEEKQAFTRRICHGNRSQLAVVLCDIFLCYSQEAFEAMKMWDELHLKKEQDGQDFTQIVHEKLHNARAALRELQLSLRGQTLSLSQQVTALYQFVDAELVRAELKRDRKHLENGMEIILKLRDAYAIIEKEDISEPLMKNTEKVYAGMTYGRHVVQENSDVAANRGYWA